MIVELFICQTRGANSSPSLFLFINQGVRYPIQLL